MDTNRLKKFAQETRIRLLKAVEDKLDYVINQDTVELREYAMSINILKNDIKEIGKEALINKVTYTWFNRLMALRFMDANDYQPLHMMVLSPKEGYTQPEILNEAMQGNISDELLIDREKVFQLLDGKIISNNPQNEVYRMLLIASCNHLYRLFPFLFEEIVDYTELLLPDDLTSEISIINDFVKGMTLEDCQEVEIIGWLYQFYISDRKDEVFAAKGKIKKEDIPAATQLFTPRWIVEYMVQNAVGKLWMQNNPHSSLIDKMPYYIETETTKNDDYLKIKNPEELTLLDQACGSGHILVYGFELFYHIYEEVGYQQSQIPQLIIEKNLFGYDIDERATQLASFAILMKARSYNRRLLQNKIQPNILQYKDLKIDKKDITPTLELIGINTDEELLKDLEIMQHATNFGSLIKPISKTDKLAKLKNSLSTDYLSVGIYEQYNLEQLRTAINQLYQISKKFSCIVGNPPYMGDSKYNKDLSEFIYNEYEDEKLDLMTCFIKSGINSLMQSGFLGMINQQTWMFISSYKNLRKYLIDNYYIQSMLHLGPRTFPEIGGEVVQNTSFILKKQFAQNESIFYKLDEFNEPNEKRLGFLRLKENHKFYKIHTSLFKKIPNYNFSYWFSPKQIQTFEEKSIGKIFNPKAGIVSGNDNQFLRLWFEASNNHISYIEKEYSKKLNWIPISKGGTFRKYYGNEEYIINIKDLWTEGKTSVSVRRGDKDFYFKKAVTWTMVCGTNFSFRFSSNITFSTASPAIFNKNYDYIIYVLGFLNSKVSTSFLPGINPTMNLGSGDVSRLPFIYSTNNNSCKELVEKSISISRLEWDSRETSWNFLQNELIRFNGQDIEEAVELYKQFWTKQFYQMHQNEEELNKEFIHIYGLAEELDPDVALEDITLLRDELNQRELKTLSADYRSNWQLNNSGEWELPKRAPYPELPFDEKELVMQFISYAVGCMFGRYSIDKAGLILANQGEDITSFFEKVGTKETLRFIPDKDGIIPVLDDEWFEDDIVSQFRLFVKAVWGEQDLERNIKYIENTLGKNLRNYFYRDFYNDHVKRYKKRPIYWMISSPKGEFQSLIYLHRYNNSTINLVLNDYYRPYITKLKNHIEHQEQIVKEGTAREQTTAKKIITRQVKIISDLIVFDKEVLYTLATARVEIDLDDGVLVNYNKLGAAVQRIVGVNDKKSIDKVKKFDWVDW